MSYIMQYAPTDTITPESNYALFGEVRAGSNGDPNGAPEVDAGTPSNVVTDRRTWDASDTSGGFDSGPVSVALVANLTGGNDRWTVVGEANGPRAFSGPTGETIKEIDLFAGVQLPAQVIWSNVQVTFYQGNTPEETINVGSGPQINTTSSSTGVGEQEFVITPTSPNDTKAILTGTVELICPDGTYPNPDDLFAQAFVVAN